MTPQWGPRGADGRWLAQVAALALAYTVTAKLGLTLEIPGTNATPVWPPTGIALAALVLWGPRLWPGVAIGALLANLGTGIPLAAVLGITAGNTLEALAGAWVLASVGFRPALGRIRDVASLCVGAAVLSTLLSAAIGVASLRLTGVIGPEASGDVFRGWWMGDLSGDVIVAAAILVLTVRRPTFRPLVWLEASGLMVLVAVATHFSINSDEPRSFLVFPLAIAAAVRYRQAGAVVATVVVAAVSTWYVVHGNGLFANQGPADGLALSQAYVAVVALSMLILAAILNERELAQKRLAESEARYRTAVDALAEGFVVEAADGSVLACNGAAERLMGHRGAGPAAGISAVREEGSEWPRDEHPATVALRSGEPCSQQLMGMRRWDGQVTWVSINARPMITGGEVTAVVCSIVDVTQRRRAEQVLHELEHRREQSMAEIVRAESRERARIATDLHDDTVQVMAATLMTLDRIAPADGSLDTQRVRDVVAESRAMLARAMERTRHLMFELRPALLEAHGLKPAIEDLAREAGTAGGFAVDMHIDVGRHSQMTEDMAYRTEREAITNARKHATASHLSVVLAEQRGGIVGTVRDDGRGFEAGSVLDRRMGLHIGLDTMTERVRLVDGQITVRSEPGRGTEIEFWIPATPRPSGYESPLAASPSK